MSADLSIINMFVQLIFLVHFSFCLIFLTNALPASNPTENYNLDFFEGDVLIRNRTNFWDRFATTNSFLKWPNGIVPYILDDVYDDSEKELIRATMEEFEKETCIKWIERTDEDYYVEIYSDMGCWSELGRVGGVQSLSLESPICMKKGVILHEMMHAMGFLHEQSRPDRDDYISIVWNNIIEGMEPNFEKLAPFELDELGLPYDYYSVMHYLAYAFASDRSRPTIRPKNRQIRLDQLGLGQTNAAFSSLDVKKIKAFYQCQSKN